MRAFTIMIYRQVKRFMRARSRVAGMILNPLVWLVFFGLGWSGAFKSNTMFGGVDYLTYLSPGLYAMTIFNLSFVSGLSVIWDREFGFLKEVLVAPASRRESIAGRIVGDSIVATFQGLVVLALTFLIANLRVEGVLPAILVGFLMALAFSSFGVGIATRMESMEGFQIIMSLLMLPLIFLSGAIYPIQTMPDWMRMLAYINPLTYAVDAARQSLTDVTGVFAFSTDIAVLLALVAVLMGVAMVLFDAATLE